MMDFSPTEVKCEVSDGLGVKLKREDEASENSEETVSKKSLDFIHQNCPAESTNAHRDDEKTYSEKEKKQFVVFSLNDFSPVEAAFSIERIQKKIFSQLKKQDLKKCRLVSHAWREFSTNENLTRNTKIKMVKDNVRNIFQDPNPVTKKKQSLEEISQIISNLGAPSFPCHRFSFSNINLLDENRDLQNFLQVYGFYIKRLTFEFRSEILNEYGLNNEVNIFKALIVVITELISNEAPNLQHLTIECNDTFNSAFKSIENEGKNPWQKIDPKNPNPNLNMNLRYLRFIGPFSSILLELILTLAPNLNEVEIPNQNQNWFVESGNKRLHLLRQMTFYRGLDSHDDFLRHVANAEGRLELRSIALCLHTVYESDEEVQKEFALLFTKILEKCSHSLEHLEWRRMRFLANSGAKIPVLPKLKEIKFSESVYEGPPEYFFPEGFRMSETFPRLKTISFHPRAINHHEDPDDILLGNDGEVVPSVTFVRTNDAVLPLEQFQRWFPNAEID